MQAAEIYRGIMFGTKGLKGLFLCCKLQCSLYLCVKEMGWSIISSLKQNPNENEAINKGKLFCPQDTKIIRRVIHTTQTQVQVPTISRPAICEKHVVIFYFKLPLCIWLPLGSVALINRFWAMFVLSTGMEVAAQCQLGAGSCQVLDICPNQPSTASPAHELCFHVITSGCCVRLKTSPSCTRQTRNTASECLFGKLTRLFSPSVSS